MSEQLEHQPEASKTASEQPSPAQEPVGVKPEQEMPPKAAEQARPIDNPGQNTDASPEAATPDQERQPKAQPMPGGLNAVFDGLVKIAPLALLLCMGCMAWPIFFSPQDGVYCPAEIKNLSAFIHSVASGSWLAPTALDNGSFSLAQWPLFGWFIGLLALIPGLTESGQLLPTASFCATFLACLAVWTLARSANFGKKEALAAGLILLCCPLFAPLPHFMGPATLGAALMLFSLAFFCHGWRRRSSWLCISIGFICATLAGLCCGWLHFITPLAASFCFLVWRGAFRRAQAGDALFGFVLMLIIIGFWLGAIMLGNGNDNYLALLFANAFQFAWPIPLKWLLPLALGILGVMPWILMVISVSWFKVISHSGQSLKESRRDNGSAFVWISLVISLCIAPFIPGFHPAAVAIACLTATLLGKAFIHLTPIGNRFFFLLAAICLIVAGIAMLAASFERTQQILFSFLPHLPVPDLSQKLLSLDTLPIMGAIILVGGLVGLLFCRFWRASGGLIYAMLLVIILCQPARLMLLPELAKMPGTPLVRYDQVEQQVLTAMQSGDPSGQVNPDSLALPQNPETAVQPAPAEPEEIIIVPEPAQPAVVEPAAPETASPQEQPAQPQQNEQQANPEAIEQPVPAPEQTPPVAAETPPGSPAPAE